MMTKKIVSIIGILIALCLLVCGLLVKEPPKKIDYFNFDGNGYEEYVGGDAYNIQIEASLRSGIIAGAKVARSVYLSASALLFVISLFGLCSTRQPDLLAQSTHTEVETKQTPTAEAEVTATQTQEESAEE